MSAQRRRRIQPLKKTTPPSRKKRRMDSSHTEIEWRQIALKGFTFLVLIINVILIVFIVQHQISKPENQSVTVETPPAPAPEIVRIEVLNGCGVRKLAAQFTDFLRAKGYDVVKTDNYESSNVEHSVVIDHKDNKTASLKLANDLGFASSQVYQAVNEIYLIDATVIIGKDFRSLSSWKSMEQNRDNF